MVHVDIKSNRSNKHNIDLPFATFQNHMNQIRGKPNLSCIFSRKYQGFDASAVRGLKESPLFSRRQATTSPTRVGGGAFFWGTK